jgi:hypothetical protein
MLVARVLGKDVVGGGLLDAVVPCIYDLIVVRMDEGVRADGRGARAECEYEECE